MYIQNSKSLVTFTEIITVHCCLFYQTHFKSIVQCKKEQQQEEEEEKEEGILADEHEILINHINLLRYGKNSNVTLKTVFLSFSCCKCIFTWWIHAGLVLCLFTLTLLINLHHFLLYTHTHTHTHIFGLTLFGWLHYITLILYFWWKYHSLLMPTFPGTQLRHKMRPWCIHQYKLHYFWQQYTLNIRLLLAFLC